MDRTSSFTPHSTRSAWIRWRSREPGAGLAVDELSEAEFAAGIVGQPAAHLSEVIWRAAYVGGAGIVMPQRSPDLPVRLTAWPKFTGGHMKPGYLKLAAAHARKPLTLAEAIQITGIKETVANDFFNAVYTLGLIEFRANSHAADIKRITGKNGLFAKIARHLALGGA